MQIFSNVSSLAIDQGLGKEAFGVAVQLHHAISSSGKMFYGSFDDILQSYQTKFLSLQTNKEQGNIFIFSYRKFIPKVFINPPAQFKPLPANGSSI